MFVFSYYQWIVFDSITIGAQNTYVEHEINFETFITVILRATFFIRQQRRETRIGPHLY